MKQTIIDIESYVLIVFALTIILFGINSCDSSGGANSERFLYTSSNDSAGNTIIVLSIDQKGQLSQIGNVPTDGVGDANEGDFDAQNSLHIIPGTNYLLAVNAGDSIEEVGIEEGNGSISVFEIDNETGLLDRIDQNPTSPNIDNKDSGGVRPVSIDSYEIGGRTWVIVGNQYHNPVFFGNNREDGVGNTRPGDPEGEIVNTNLRNVTAFEFVDGVLVSQKTVAIYTDGLNGGPANVSFSPDGKKVAVSTWGVPHFDQEGMPNENVQLPSRIYIYDVLVSNSDLELIKERFFEKIGIAGTIGFSWSPDGEAIFAANANLAQEPESLEDFSVTVISTGETPALLNNSEVPPFGDAACWTLLTTDGMRLYIASFALNIVSLFEVSAPSVLTLVQTLVRQESPILDTKDMFMTKDNKYFYVNGPLRSHTVSIYEVDSDGFLTELTSSPFLVPSAHPDGVNVSPESQAFLGLVGY